MDLVLRFSLVLGAGGGTVGEPMDTGKEGVINVTPFQVNNAWKVVEKSYLSVLQYV